MAPIYKTRLQEPFYIFHTPCSVQIFANYSPTILDDKTLQTLAKTIKERSLTLQQLRKLVDQQQPKKKKKQTSTTAKPVKRKKKVAAPANDTTINQRISKLREDLLKLKQKGNPYHRRLSVTREQVAPQHDDRKSLSTDEDETEDVTKQANTSTSSNNKIIQPPVHVNTSNTNLPAPPIPAQQAKDAKKQKLKKRLVQIQERIDVIERTLANLTHLYVVTLLIKFDREEKVCKLEKEQLNQAYEKDHIHSLLRKLSAQVDEQKIVQQQQSPVRI